MIEDTMSGAPDRSVTVVDPEHPVELNIMPIVIDGYLTEEKLGSALKALAGDQWVGRQVKLPGSNYRWDTAFQQNGKQVLVEFDGDEHYCNSLKIMVDRKKTRSHLLNRTRLSESPSG
jgi:hypothetical protein